MITVFAAKGGCGKTTVAINLAVALAEDPDRRVALVDLDLRNGDVAATLGLTAGSRPLDDGDVGAAVRPLLPGWTACSLPPAR